MQLGEPVIVAGDPGYLADYGVPDLGILYGPFLFNDNEQCYKIAKSDWFKQTTALMETKGLKIFCANWVTGIRHLLTNKPVRVPADLAGMKIRVPSNRIQTEIFKILGAAPVGMSLGEVYTALQTGTIDGGENPLSTLYSRKHYEVSKYLLMSGHERVVNMWITSSAVYNKMTPQQQALLSSTGEEVGIEYNNEQTSSEKEYMQKMIKEGGITVTEMTPELEKLFKDATRSFYDKGDMFGWSKGLYEKVLAAMK
jgi:TRAP-type C4-dicarboxylate transport system substrate-binding protein